MVGFVVCEVVLSACVVAVERVEASVPGEVTLFVKSEMPLAHHVRRVARLLETRIQVRHHFVEVLGRKGVRDFSGVVWLICQVCTLFFLALIPVF